MVPNGPQFLRGTHAPSRATPVRLGLAAPRRNTLEREQSMGKMPVVPTARITVLQSAGKTVLLLTEISRQPV
jgi:hypothetical protein